MNIDIDFDKEIEKYKLFMKESRKMPELTAEQVQELNKELEAIIRNPMEKMVEYAKAAFEKHKEIDIAYKMRQQNDKVSEKDVEEMIEKYKKGVRFNIQPVDMSPTGAKIENATALENK